MIHLLIKWLVYALIVMFAAWVVPGIQVESFFAALLVAVVLALINTFIKPVLKFITLPINVLTLGLFTLVLNALLLMFAAFITPGFSVEGFWSALLGSVIIAILGAGVERLTD